MAVEVIQTNTAATVKPMESKPVTIEPVATAAEPAMAVKEKQGSKQSASEDGKETQEKKPSERQIKSAVNHVNSQLKRTGCQFSYHKETNRVSIKIIDKDTDEVIREIPPEETLEMVEKMWELAGILVDEKR